MCELKQMSQVLKETLGLRYVPVSVRFSDELPTDISRKHGDEFYHDTACTALCRCIKQEKKLILAPEGNKQGIPVQPCAGANFFFQWGKISIEEACDVYVKTEQVFAREETCRDFLKQVPPYPVALEGKSIILSPLDQENETPQVIVFVVNAAQASRILGWSVYHQYQEARVLPAISTCISLYLPLTDGKVYLNLIDYYDRYHQGKKSNQEEIWKEDEQIVSMTFSRLQKMMASIELSPHGNFKPELTPQGFDPIL